MMKLIACELFRLRRSRILLIIAIAMCAFGVALADPGVLADQPPVPDMPGDVQGIFMAEAADAGFALLLFGNIAAAYLLGSQFSERTIGHDVMSGHSRSEVFGSRCLTCVFLPVALTLLALIAGIARNAFILPPIQPFAFAYFLRTAALLIPLYAALAAPVALIIAGFRDTARSTAAVVVYMLLVLWSFSVLMHFSPVVPGTVYTDDPGILLMLHPVFLVRWILRSDLDVVQMAVAVVVSLGWTAAFVGASWAVLRRCEMK